MPREESKKQTAMGIVVDYSKPYFVIILIAVICAAGASILSVIGPDFISKMVRAIQDGIGLTAVSVDMNFITQIGLTLVGIYSGSVLLAYLQGFIMNHVSFNIGKRIRHDISNKINRIPLSYFDTHNFGDTLSRVTNDVDSLSQSMNTSILTIISALTTLIGCALMMFMTEWHMALTAIIASLLGFALMAFVMGKSQRHFDARQESLAEVNVHVEEYLVGQPIVRAYNAEERNLKNFSAMNEKLRKHTFSAEFYGGLMMPLMGFIGSLGYVAVCVVGAMLTFNGLIHFSVVIAFMLYVRIFTSPLSQIGQGFSGILSALAAGNRVAEFLDEAELSLESNTKTLEKVVGNVSFNNVHFEYLPGKPIINNFFVDIKAGQKVAIVGPTGAGKTTLVNLLMRFYDVSCGHISVDDIPLNQLTRANVHDIFGMVLQDTWLFEGTVRDNLTYGKQNCSDQALLDICNQCGLEYFIKTLPYGLDTVLNENSSVSAGQKQLLTIARAMVENAPMLILDEATSSVDTRTERKIQKAMDLLVEGRTSFVIAHRLSTIKNADIILYMEKGDVVEMGDHTTLMNLKGKYEALYNSQFA